MKINKETIFKIGFWFFFGLLLSSVELVTIRKICFYPEHGPNFYGFPMIYRTNTTWVNTGSGNIYVVGLFINSIFWGGLSYVISNSIRKLINSRSVKIGITITLLLSTIFNCFIFSCFDLSFKFHHTSKMNYYQQDIECERTVEIFNLWTDNPYIHKAND
ncbi:MAG: hypothetical protein ACJATI_001524 [Halioglobus sp.]|jgi:hypothetical protein